MSETYLTLRQPALDRLAASIPQDLRLSPEQRQIPTGVYDVRQLVLDTGLLSDEEVDLTSSYSATELCRKLASREITSERLTKAFLRRAALTTQFVNCCSSLCGETALARARELDQILAETGKTVGPLHGLPISFKESIIIEGEVSHASYVAFVNDAPAKADGLLASAVRAAGGICFARTTQPQSIMSLECRNNVYGETLFGWDVRRTPGGSSGGESSLISMDASALGIGTDIGGSVRNPSSLTAGYAFRPTTFRLPAGTRGLHKGRETVNSSAGPMTRYPEDLQLFTEALIAQRLWQVEPSLLPFDWRKQDACQALPDLSHLTVGVFFEDGLVRPLPAVYRAIKVVVEALKTAGAEVIDWDCGDFHGDRHWSILSRLYYPNGAEDERRTFAAGGESACKLTDWVMTQPGVKDHTHDELDSLLLERNAFRTAFQQHWHHQAQTKTKRKKIDVILCPASPGPAPLRETTKYWHYTSIWNLVDFPGVAFPAPKAAWCDGKQDAADAEAMLAQRPLAPGSKEEYVWTQSYGSYADMHGLPIGLQLVAQRYQDEKLLRALELIESEALGRSSSRP